jgi:MFS family permease
VDDTNRRQSRKALFVVLGCMLCQMGAGFFYASRALSAEVIGELGWSRTLWASGMAPMLVVSSVSQAFVGAACTRFGVRPVVVASLLCLAVSVVLFGTMQGIWTFYVAMMVLALANAGIGDVSIGSVITKWFERRRSLALGFAMVGSNLGSIVYIGAMGQLLDEASWRTAALAVGLGGVAVILPIAFFSVRDPASDEGAAAERVDDDRGEPVAASMPLGDALRRPAFWILFYSLFCYSLVQLGLVDQFVLYLTDLGYSEQEAFGALQLTVGAGIAAKLGAGVVGLLIPARTAFLLNTGLLAFSLALVPFAGNPWILTLFSVGFGLSTASRDVLLPLAVADAFGVRAFAQIYGMMILAFVPGGALGPIVLAEAHRVFGHYRPGFLACVVLVALAFVGLAFMPRGRAFAPVEG